MSTSPSSQDRTNRDHEKQVEQLKSRINSMETECCDARMEAARVKAESQITQSVSTVWWCEKNSFVLGKDTVNGLRCTAGLGTSIFDHCKIHFWLAHVRTQLLRCAYFLLNRTCSLETDFSFPILRLQLKFFFIQYCYFAWIRPNPTAFYALIHFTPVLCKHFHVAFPF